MSFFRTALFLCPAACLLAQQPPAQSTSTQTSTQTQSARPATPVPPPPVGQKTVNPDGSVTMSMPIPKPLAQVPPETVILTVGDFTVTAQQFDQICDGLQDQYKNFAKGPGRKQFADQLVRVLSLAEEGKRLGLDKTPTFQTQLKFNSDSALANATAQKINSETKIDDAAMRAYYEQHKTDYEQVRARHILIRFKGSPVPVRPGQNDLTDEQALAKATDLRKQLAAGADFAKLATAESDDVGSAAQGGDLGLFGHGRMVPAFDQAAFKLKPGEISEPVKSQFGYHIIRVDAVENKTFEEAKPEIEKKMRPQMAQQAMEEIAKKTKVVYDPTFFGMEKK